MDTILIFVVLPLATIIFSIALQRLLKCPILVAAVVFAIFLILTYTVFGTDFLIFAILFALLAFITAFLTCLICKIIRRLQSLEDREADCDDNSNGFECSCSNNNGRSKQRSGRNNREGNCNNSGDDEKLLTISSRCGNGENTDLLTISTGGTSGNNNSNNCGCNSYNNDSIVVNAEIVPNNNGRSGCFRGAFRRRC